MGKINRGDYVIATKYDDGDPGDEWAVGFYDDVLPKVTGERHMVVDAEGQHFRGNGFRRVEKISAEQGRWILSRKSDIEKLDRSVWEWVKEVRQSLSLTPLMTREKRREVVDII